ncbi:MAG: V-type ATP synthase subunit A [Candidatus Margulisiibacteriota bacterium]
MAGKISKVSGPLIIATGLEGVRMGDMVKVGKIGIIGEIIEILGDNASIQVYEESAGLKDGDPVETQGRPLSVELGPGLLGNIFDGIQRPLRSLMEESGDFISRGIDVPSLDQKKKWEFKASVKAGSKVAAGDVLGTVQETSLITHKIMVPHEVSGTVKDIKSGSFGINDTIAVIDNHKVTMKIFWPVRKPRPLAKKQSCSVPLVTGQRIIDTFFPIAKGGTACVPGPFGAGKTVIQHQIAKWADADIIVFVGCGERGNEMTDVLIEFPELKDPKSGKSLMERTILIANTSNMPIAAREASVYTGIAIAEYYRDMGYNVALMADSTSRWAEALREMSGRLEEMPGEEGYPAYLGTRVAEFYERSGWGICHGQDKRTGSLSVIGSVSPPGGDLSEPVVQNTLRVAKVFWGLDYKLAHQRHFPAINWLISYSLYLSNIEKYLGKNIASDFDANRAQALNLLNQEAKLEEIVRLVGVDALSIKEQLVLVITKSIREDFLYQSAFDAIDQYSSMKKQYYLLKTIVSIYNAAASALDAGAEVKDIQQLGVWPRIARARFVEESKIEAETSDIMNQAFDEINKLKGALTHA